VKEQAEVLRHSLVAGCISRDDVVEWALSMVAEDDRPVAEIIEIAVAGNVSRGHLVELLAAVPGCADRALVLRRVPGVLDAALQADPSTGEAIAKWLLIVMVSHVF